MPDQPITPITSVENPQTLREVGIHLGTFAKALEDIKNIEAKHHAENVSRNEAIIKKLDEMKDSHIARNEFEEYKKSTDNRFVGVEDSIKAEEDKTRNYTIVQGLVFGCVSLILVAVVTGIVYLVVNH